MRHGNYVPHFFLSIKSIIQVNVLKPILMHLNIFGNSFAIGSYGVIVVFAIIVATLISLMIAQKKNYSFDECFTYIILLVCGGISGTFVVGFILFLPDRFQNGFLSYPPVLVSWGGLIGGILVGLVIDKYYHFSFWKLADLATPGYLIGLGIGRIGCLLGGCCYGIHTDSTLGIYFSNPNAPATIMIQPLIPTQIISSIFLITMALIFIPFVIKEHAVGKPFLISMIIYSIARFSIEFLRNDPRLFLFGLSDGQLFSIALLLFALGMIFLRNRKNDIV
jgi:phosphatidylglycerol:prolipoprotein diacylglycerol transferase